MDARIAKSKNAIKQGLLTLLANHKLSDISVCMLCSQAHVNRNTFYAHYQYPEQALDEIAEQILMDMFAICFACGNSVVAANKLCEYIKEHQDVCGVLLSANAEGHYMKTAILHAQALAKQTFNPSEFTPAEQEYVNIYIVAGSIAVLRHWMSTGMKDDLPAVGAAIDRLLQHLIHRDDPKPASLSDA